MSLGGDRDGRVDVSVVIVSWNARALLRDCLSSVYDQTQGVSFEVIVVDNASSDGSAAMVRRDFSRALVIENAENLGFVAANNQAFEIAKGRYFLLLNSDTIVLDDAIAGTVAYADLHPKGAAFGCKVLNRDRSLQLSCFMFPSCLNMLFQATYLYKVFPRSRLFGREFLSWWDHEEERRVQAISGCFSLVRKEAVDAVGPMDPIFFFYGDDVDWCRRFAQAGWEVRYFPGARIVHFGGQSTSLMRRSFRLQLTSAALVFCRLHYGLASFVAYRLLAALFYALRIPLWAAKAIVDPSRRRPNLETAGTYCLGALFCLFRWRGLAINRAALDSRFPRLGARPIIPHDGMK
jgi:GT2 family glycosyltransferase